MGLIGIKIRIARKEKVVHEFILNGLPEQKAETQDKKIEDEAIAKTESEQIKIEEEKMKTLVTLEEEEQRLK
jgi:small subunit ribosomal protein S3